MIACLEPKPNKPFWLFLVCRYGSIEPDPDNPQQSYLDYVESFPLNAEPEVSPPLPPTEQAVLR